jgi:malonyl-ACP decarboxylase
MVNYNQFEMLLTGIGISSAIGQGKVDFASSLMQGQQVFGVMKRPGRQKGSAFIGAEIQALHYPERFSNKVLRTTSFSEQVALVTLNEAWEEAGLSSVDPFRIGLIVGGSNFQQRDLIQTLETYKDRMPYIPPTYGFSFVDSDLCGLCTEQFGIKGFAYTIGGASASGQLAIIQAIQAIQSGQVDICIAMGALMDISYWECQALRSLGAMGSDRYANDPAKACRPFDKNHDGFIYGESCGAVVIESIDSAIKRHMEPYAKILSWSVVMDGNRNPNPSYDGEVRVIKKALEQGKLSPQDIDYINPHGTGSVVGDEIELKAIRDCNLSHAYINATKSITGHGLSSAGTIEVIATLLQMKDQKLHPTINLEDPIEPGFNWILGQSAPHSITNALNLSMGFGGINTAICLSRHK